MKRRLWIYTVIVGMLGAVPAISAAALGGLCLGDLFTLDIDALCMEIVSPT